LFDGRFLAKLFPITFPVDFSNSNLKVGTSFPESRGSGTLFLKLRSLIDTFPKTFAAVPSSES
jgi:hypothetical protein